MFDKKEAELNSIKVINQIQKGRKIKYNKKEILFKIGKKGLKKNL